MFPVELKFRYFSGSPLILDMCIIELRVEVLFAAVPKSKGLKSYLRVITQVQMPVMDGFQATTKIREMEKTRVRSLGMRKFMPVVAMTAHAMSGDAERIISAGMDGYISKPLNAKKLQELLLSISSGQLQKSLSLIPLIDDDNR